MVCSARSGPVGGRPRGSPRPIAEARCARAEGARDSSCSERDGRGGTAGRDALGAGAGAVVFCGVLTAPSVGCFTGGGPLTACAAEMTAESRARPIGVRVSAGGPGAGRGAAAGGAGGVGRGVRGIGTVPASSALPAGDTRGGSGAGRGVGGRAGLSTGRGAGGGGAVGRTGRAWTVLACAWKPGTPAPPCAVKDPRVDVSTTSCPGWAYIAAAMPTAAIAAPPARSTPAVLRRDQSRASADVTARGVVGAAPSDTNRPSGPRG